MSSSPVCTCGVCPAHGPAGPGADHPGAAAGWADPARRYLESAVEWLDGPEAMGAGHGELEARLQDHSREQYRLLFPGSSAAATSASSGSAWLPRLSTAMPTASRRHSAISRWRWNRLEHSSPTAN